jgi:hypothetical protein
MTRFGHDPIQKLGHDRDPVMTHNTKKKIKNKNKNTHVSSREVA